MFTNPDFLQVVANSFQYMALTVVSTLLLALLLALFLKKNTRINAILQSAIFAPYVISFVSVSFIWMWMMDSSYGLLNFLLNLIHVPSVRWLEDPKVAIYSLVLVAIWKGVGYNTIIFISGLQSIPTYLYEAASLDGAKPAGVFFKITLPMLSPTSFFLTLVNIISSFKVFETISIMTKGGPMNSTNTLVYYLYEYGFVYYKIGYASSVGVVLMVIIGILTILYFKVLSTNVHYR
ncbi:MAG: carbohydrate ABC transporter permease [Acetanaerobacterium sp.]